jgi:hypothetical protein
VLGSDELHTGKKHAARLAHGDGKDDGGNAS